MTNKIIITDETNPWKNLAVEQLLFNRRQSGVTLLLWRNADAVVVGRNQNAWKECRVSLLESEGGKLARRASGGGAVYHDLGNLNFTFIMPRGSSDLARQFSVVRRAVEGFGIETRLSGRNDLSIADKGKFSGSAFRYSDETALHHGTILVCSDLDKLERYLAPSEQKLRAKGVESVRARVRNLSDENAKVTVNAVRRALTDAFIREYGDAQLSDCGDCLELDSLVEMYSSWEWRFGKTPRFDLSISNRFDWGNLELSMTCHAGRVSDAKVFTDAMDEALAQRAESAIKNAPFSAEALAKCLETAVGGVEGKELAGWLRGQRF